MTEEEAIKWIDYHIDISDYDKGDEILQALKMARKALANQKTGQWIINSDGYYPTCSNCKSEPEGRTMPKYCPDCGSRMTNAVVLRRGRSKRR